MVLVKFSLSKWWGREIFPKKVVPEEKLRRESFLQI